MGSKSIFYYAFCDQTGGQEIIIPFESTSNDYFTVDYLPGVHQIRNRIRQRRARRARRACRHMQRRTP